jgi:hypothetical protein
MGGSRTLEDTKLSRLLHLASHLPSSAPSSHPSFHIFTSLPFRHLRLLYTLCIPYFPALCLLIQQRHTLFSLVPALPRSLLPRPSLLPRGSSMKNTFPSNPLSIVAALSYSVTLHTVQSHLPPSLTPLTINLLVLSSAISPLLQLLPPSLVVVQKLIRISVSTSRSTSFSSKQ